MEINYEFVDLNNQRLCEKIKQFLNKFNLRYTQVDLTLVGWHENEIVAVCSKLNNLIKNIAVCEKYTGLNITNSLITKMLAEIEKQNYNNAFIITKFTNKKIFLDLNFKLIYENNNVAFLALHNESFISYKNYLQSQKFFKRTAVIILNANPLTKGHLHLITTASLENDIVYLIPVLEDVSLFTYAERKVIIETNLVTFSNVVLLEGTEYLISKNFFPSYFLKSDEETILEQALLDCYLFSEFVGSKTLIRYVGEEPFSQTTNTYNQVIATRLASEKITLKMIPRLEINNKPVSASTVRELLYQKDLQALAPLVSKKTFDIITQEKFLERAWTHPELVFKNN